MRSRSWRKVVSAVVVGALVSASGALALGAGGGGPARAKSGGPVQVELVSASQATILDEGRLEVRVDADEALKLRLRGLSRRGGGHPSKVAKSRRARLDAGESKTVKLPLTSDGRLRLADCGQQDIVIKARASELGDRLGDRDDDHTRVTEQLAVDGPGCAAATPGGGAGGGEGGGGASTEPSTGERCDPLDSSVCLYPWPNDYFTVPDPSTPTGRRVNLDVLSMPRSRQEVPILPEPFNRSDGFSPGNMIITKVPGLDSQQAFDNTGAVPITEIEESFDPDQPVVVINADTGQRQLIWSEIDSNPSEPADKTLIIRPAENFEEGERYIVALRNLKDADGDTIPAQDPFEDYRDQTPTDDPVVEARRPHMEEIFDTLAAAGIQRDDLYLAWDFTVASEQNLSERALHIRDDAFAQLGDTDLSDLQIPPASTAPVFTVDSVTNYTAAEDSRIARTVEGTFTVPCYLNAPGCPTGSQFLFAPGTNIPTQIPGNTMSANYICIIPRTAVDGLNPPAARPSLYGHGLLGEASEVEAGNVKAMAFEHNMTFCATDWAGFAFQDIPTILATLQDLNNFPKFVDRTQQGMLNFLYLGRLMIHPDGFVSDPAFQAGTPAEPVLDTTRLFYDGNSQGGILGGALAALAPDYDRAVLGVPGMNYSTLLRRSSDFDTYAEGKFAGQVCDELPEPYKTICNTSPGSDTPFGLYDNYPNELERPLILSLLQMQWDRAEANGYALHMTSDPLPNTPPHNVLMHVSFGDHQVTMWAAEVEARTIGAAVHWPALDDGRHPDDDPGPGDEPLFGIPHIASYPFSGSALVYWDGTVARDVFPPPITETPPSMGNDPHSYPRSDPDARDQKSAFLSIPGEVIDVCGGAPCYADGI